MIVFSIRRTRYSAQGTTRWFRYTVRFAFVTRPPKNRPSIGLRDRPSTHLVNHTVVSIHRSLCSRHSTTEESPFDVAQGPPFDPFSEPHGGLDTPFALLSSLDHRRIALRPDFIPTNVGTLFKQNKGKNGKGKISKL
ncbi:MAG: hypothetical protein RLY64_1293 [Bacteroidota bacterium]|jgi:hypothetical protein